MKTCTVCNETKEAWLFYRNKYMKDRLENQCKECKKKAVTAGRRKRIEVTRANDRLRRRTEYYAYQRQAHRVCAGCTATLPYTFFYMRAGKPYGECKECRAIQGWQRQKQELLGKLDEGMG